MPYPQDFIVAARLGIGVFDHQAHLGNLWASGDYQASLANGANIDILIQMPAGVSAHVSAEGAVGAVVSTYTFAPPGVPPATPVPQLPASLP